MNRDDVMLDIIQSLNGSEFIQLKEKKEYNITKNTDIIFLLLPQWSAFLPPFNLGRLSSILLNNGYNSRCIDLNIECHEYSKQLIKNNKIQFNLWDSTRSHMWKSFYHTDVHPLFEQIFKNTIDQIEKINPKVIGFTLYWSNEAASLFMLNELKKRLPNTIFLGGGPSSHSRLDFMKNNFDIVVVGEAEKIILEVFDKIENGYVYEKGTVLTHPENHKISLNDFPLPNYDDFDFSKYIIPNGIITEFSRGCVAKCTFCEETHFWKYRQKDYIKVVDEIEEIQKQKGINTVWFVDSLVNGNLTELKLFCEEIIKRNIKIYWLGYARHDNRMDLEYFTLLKKSGCVSLNYGSESGSNKVLEDMKKRVTKEDMEQNLIDGAKVGIGAITGWIISFPTEEISDFVETMILIWRNRNNNIQNILSSNRFEMGPQTIVGQNPFQFGLMPRLYQGCHISEDLSKNKLQCLIRAKCWEIFKEELTKIKSIAIQKRNELQNHYTIKYDNIKSVKNVDYDVDFNFNILKSNINKFVDSAINEPFGLFRILYKSRGGYEIKITFNKDVDLKEFGHSVACNFNGYVEFKIDDCGKWNYDIDVIYIQDKNPFKTYSEIKGNTIATKRARKLSKVSWGTDDIPDNLFKEIEIETDRLNKSLDLSFKYKNKINGDWGIKTKSLF